MAAPGVTGPVEVVATAATGATAATAARVVRRARAALASPARVAPVVRAASERCPERPVRTVVRAGRPRERRAPTGAPGATAARSNVNLRQRERGASRPPLPQLENPCPTKAKAFCWFPWPW